MKKQLIYCLAFIFVFNMHQIGWSQCTCLEQKSELSSANLQLCENFESFALNAAFPNNNNNWTLWPGTSSKGIIKNVPGSVTTKALLIQENGNNSPDLVLKLGNKTKGRYRVSWQIYVPKGQRAYYNFQHEANVTTGNWAFEVHFLETGIGFFQLGQDTISKFPILLGSWNKVMHMIDLDTDQIELWVNNELVDAWKFSLGSTSDGKPADSKQLGAINFYAAKQTNYYVDNLCVWERGSFNSAGAPVAVCLKNGQTIRNAYAAKTQFLYTDDEIAKEKCADLCSFAGLNVKGSLYPRIGIETPIPPLTSIDSRSILPNTIINHECLEEVFSEMSRKQLRGVVYPYTHRQEYEGFLYVNVNLDSQSIADLEVVVFECSSPNTCIPLEKLSFGDNEFSVGFSLAPKKQYIIIILARKSIRFGIDIKPSHIILDCVPYCPCENQKVAIREAELLQNQKALPISYVEKLFNVAPRDYLGGEITYILELAKPGIANFSLNARNDSYCMYLSGETCNKNLLAFASADKGGTASISMHLEAGIYNLTVDQLTLNSNASFSINYTLNPSSVSSRSTPSSCPVVNNQLHRVLIRGNPLLFNGDPLTLQDRIYLVNARNKNYRELDAYNWNGNELEFKLYADNLGDNLTCGYAEGEAIEFAIVRDNKIYAVTPFYQREDGTEITASNKFKKGGQSLILGFVANLNINNLGISSFPNLDAGTKSFVAEINSNNAWTLERKNVSSASWLKFEPQTGTGIKDVTFTVSANPLNTPREETIYLVNPEGFYKTVTLKQAGRAPGTTTSSTSGMYANEQIKIYPNPSNGFFQIAFDFSQPMALEINVLDALGRIIWEKKRQVYFQMPLNLDLLAQTKGIYWIQFKTEQGAFFKKIVCE